MTDWHLHQGHQRKQQYMHLGLTGEASLESKFLNNHKLKELRMLGASQSLRVLQPWTQRNLLPYPPTVTTVPLLQVCVFQPEKFVPLVIFTCMVRNWSAKGHDSGTCFFSPVTGQLYLWGRGFCNNRDISIPCAAALGVEICQVSLGWSHGLAISGASLSLSGLCECLHSSMFQVFMKNKVHYWTVRCIRGVVMVSCCVCFYQQLGVSSNFIQGLILVFIESSKGQAGLCMGQQSVWTTRGNNARVQTNKTWNTNTAKQQDTEHGLSIPHWSWEYAGSFYILPGYSRCRVQNLWTVEPGGIFRTIPVSSKSCEVGDAGSCGGSWIRALSCCLW